MKVNEFIQKCDGLKDSYIIAALTDEFIVDRYPLEKYSLDGKEDKILEIRVFNENEEYKLFRTDIGKTDFYYRHICDEVETRDYFDEVQYLDIDTSIGADSGIVTSTGGGKYNLPIANAKKILIRY